MAHKALKALQDGEHMHRVDSGVILRMPSSGNPDRQQPLSPSRSNSHLRSLSAPHTPVFSPKALSSDPFAFISSNWADEMDQVDRHQKTGSMRVKRLKELMDDDLDEASIIERSRSGEGRDMIAIPGSKFVEEEEERRASPSSPKGSRRRRSPLQSPITIPLEDQRPARNGPGKVHSPGSHSPKSPGSPKNMSPGRQKDKARANRPRGGLGSPSHSQSPPKLVRLQTGLCVKGPLLPPDYHEEDVVRDWNEPVEGLPVPVGDDPHLAQGAPPNTHLEVAHDPYHPGGQLHFLVPNIRQSTINHMKHQFRDPKVRVFMAEFEEDLTSVTVQFLEEPSINPYKGSVPVERIQNVVRTKCPDLYSKVVGRSHGSWKKYVEKHDEVFQLFSVEEGKWRMRLVKHTEYKIGDEKEVAARLAWEAHFTKTLIAHLRNLPSRTCKVDEFMAQYPHLPGNVLLPDGSLEFPLPPRGDLVRFVKRHPQYFTYDQSLFLIGLKSTL